MSTAQARADIIAYATLAEMNHFQQSRVADFKRMMQDYLQQQINFYQQVGGTCEGVTPDIIGVVV